MNPSLPRMTLYSIAILFNLGIIVYIRQHYERDRETIWFSVFTGSVLGLSATDLAKSVASVPDVKLFFFLSRLVFKWSIAISLLIFAYHYTNNSDKLTPVRLTSLSTLGITGTFIALTDPIHHLMWSQFNGLDKFGGLNATPTILFHIQLGLIYAVIAWSIVLLSIQLIKSPRSTSEQLIVVVFGMVTASVAHLSQSYNVVPNYGSGYAVATVLATGGTAYGLFYADILKNKPVTLDQIFSSVEEGLVVTTEDWEVVEYNSRGEEFLQGITYGVDLRDTHPELFNDESLAETISLGDINKNTYVINSSKLQTRRGDLQGFIITIQDVTRVREVEQQLQHESNQLDTFASFISHDLRNPLSVAKLYAEEVGEDIDDDRIPPVINSLERMDQMIDDGLTYAREGRTIDKQEFVSLKKVADQAWQTSYTKKATLTICCEDTEVYCDKQRVRTLLENLYRNASEHSDEQVDVTVGKLTKAEGFYVADTGPGIPNNVDAFEQGVSTQDDGSGLGLSIVTSIASAHDWEVKQKDSKSGGTRFEFHNVTVSS